MARLAILTAIIFILGLTKLGYIQFGVIEITTVLIPVAIGAIILGPGAGAFLGAMFGLTSFIQCFGMSPFGAALLAVNPILTFITCMIPRILCGWLAGLVFKAFSNFKGKGAKILSFPVSALSCAVFNTVFFVISFMLLFSSTSFMTELRAGRALMPFLAWFVGLNGLVEAIVCFIVAAAVAKALAKYIPGK